MILVVVFAVAAGLGMHMADQNKLKYPAAVRQRLENTIRADDTVSDARLECIIATAEKYIHPDMLTGHAQADSGAFQAAAKDIMNNCPKD